MNFLYEMIPSHNFETFLMLSLNFIDINSILLFKFPWRITNYNAYISRNIWMWNQRKWEKLGTVCWPFPLNKSNLQIENYNMLRNHGKTNKGDADWRFSHNNVGGLEFYTLILSFFKRIMVRVYMDLYR